MGYQDQITWAWHNPGPPSGPMGGECAAVVIDGTQRGNRTAHDCVVECITAWVSGQNIQVALEWLTKGAQCHNKEAQKELNEAGARAVRYAVETYGPLLNLGDLKLSGFDKPAASKGKEKAASTGNAAKATPAPKAAKAPTAAKAPKTEKAPAAKKAPVAAKPVKAEASPKLVKAPAASKAAPAAKVPAAAKPAKPVSKKTK